MSDTTQDSSSDLSEATGFLQGLLERMQVPATVAGQDVEDKLLLNISCENEEDTQRIIGKRGQVVDSLQHLVNKMMSRERVDRGRPVIVDAGGYREQHVDRLEELAIRMADQARDRGEAVDLIPMSAYDRRIVHMHIAEMEGVGTRSEGEGHRRHIVVFPE